MKRRKFINAFGVVGGGLMLGKSGKLLAFNKSGFPMPLSGDDDDTFWRKVRQQFIYPDDYIYFNTGGIGATPEPVLEVVEQEVRAEQKAPRPGHDHTFWVELKKSVANYLGPGCLESEIALTGTATEGINIILNGLRLKEGDEVITTTHEHAALHVPLLNRKRLNGVVVKSFAPDPTSGTKCLNQIEALITAKTRLIFVSHVTCTTGYRLPVEEIGRLAHDRGILFALDGAQAVGSIPVDLSQIPVDFYAGCAHKWLLAPKHTGFLWLRKDKMDLVEPTSVGAYSDNGFDVQKGTIAFQDSATRFEYGTQNEANFRGFAASLDFIEKIGPSKIFEHNRQLAEHFVSGLESIPGLIMLSSTDISCRSSLISFQINGKLYTDVANTLTGKKRIRVRVVPEAGVNGVRVSFHLYNQMEEVDRLLAELKTIANT